MNCERARELFSDYLEGSMDAALAAVIRGHVDKCPDCAREFESFKITWGMLNVLPEIEAPRDFRHDVVMRAVRQQQERAQAAKRNSGINWDQILNKFIPVRQVAFAVGAAAVLFLLLHVPETAYHGFTGMFNPKVGISHSTGPQERTAVDSSPMPISAARVQDWQTRKLGRNTVWVSVNPRDNGDGSSVYCVTLSLNKAAFLPGESSERLGAQVYLLPSGQFSLSDLTASSAIWSGNILESSSVVVPCLMDETRGKAGTINLFVTWEFRHRRFGYVVFVPTHKAGRTGETFDFSTSGRDFAESQSSLYAALQGMAEDYGTPIITNAYLTERPTIINLGRESLKSALIQTLKSTDLEWVYTDGAVYVDRYRETK